MDQVEINIEAEEPTGRLADKMRFPDFSNSVRGGVMDIKSRRFVRTDQDAMRPQHCQIPNL
jgi:hypothetical protein